jgi:DNA protecting protein DprA
VGRLTQWHSRMPHSFAKIANWAFGFFLLAGAPRRHHDADMKMTAVELATLIEAHWQLGESQLRHEMMLLVTEHGSIPSSAAFPELVRRLGLTVGSQALQHARTHLDRNGFVVTLLYADYPRRIRALLGDSAPPILYCRGNPGLFSRPGISIIGTRRPTPHGMASARAYAAAFAAHRRVVVSGNAPGIDAAAHDEVLRAGGSTIVFPPTAMDQYAPQFAAAASESRILIASPFPPGQAFQKYFPLRRNQLVAAQALASIIAETGTRGGTLNTVQHIRRFGRPMFVVRMPEGARHGRAPESLIASGACGIPLKPGPDTLQMILETAAKPLPRSRPVVSDLFATDGTK